MENHVKSFKTHSYFYALLFQTRCNKHNLTKNPSEFWNTIKPFMTDKYKSKGFAIIIQIKEGVINYPNQVGDAFNEYYSNVALTIGYEGPLTDVESIDDILCKYDDHDSIKCIRNHNPSIEPF